MSAGMLPKFHVRNLRSSSQPTENLVRISAPAYDTTIFDNPAATLRYRDEDGDKITLGSSHELTDKLEEPISQSSAGSSRRKKDRMSIAMVLSDVEQNPDTANHHTFDIDEREEIQKLWQEIQQRNRTPPPASTPDIAEALSSGHQAKITRSPKSGNKGQSLEKSSERRDCKIISPTKLGIEESKVPCNEEKHNKLAAAYCRFKVDIWTPVAAELGISWEEAEALHWVLGKDEMIRRAEKLDCSQTESFEDPVSVKSTDANRHENRKNMSKPTVNNSATRNLEDYPQHHFNATMPPQIRNAAPANQVTSRLAVGKASYAGIANSTLAKGTFPSLVTPAANLTREGKRQAQAAGDILRSRSTPSRHRKAVPTGSEHTSNQNRWANYKSPNTAFSPTTSAPLPLVFGAPTLTPEGRRQAQAAGDKLRSRTNPIRHSRPSRSGSLEHGVNKNRWASYIAPRVARSEEPNPNNNSPTELKEELQSKDTATEQPSLLEVFEAELAKSFPTADDVTSEGQAPEPEIVDIAAHKRDSQSPSSESNNVSAPAQVASPTQSARAALHGIDLFNEYVNRLTSPGGAQEFSNVVDQGVRAATGPIEALVRGVPGHLHDALGQAKPTGAVQQETDIKGIDEALSGLREFVNSIATGLGEPSGSIPSADSNPDEKDAKVETITTGPNALPIKVSSENASEEPDNAHAPAGEEQVSSLPEAGTKVMAASSNVRQPPTPRYFSDARATQQTQIDDDFSTQHKNIMGGPRYHKPGPIHLPQARPLSDDHANSNSLQHPRSTISADKAMATSPPAATRFPTLAQFEGQNFAATSSFPALPSMEPLVPQRVGPETIVHMLDEPPRANCAASNPLAETSQQHNFDVEYTTATHRGDKGNNPTFLTDDHLASSASQSSAKQRRSIHEYVQNLKEERLQHESPQVDQTPPLLNSKHGLSRTRHEPLSSDTGKIDLQNNPNSCTQNITDLCTPNSGTQKSNYGLQDYEMQRMILEQQHKCLLMARTGSGAEIPQEQSPYRDNDFTYRMSLDGRMFNQKVPHATIGKASEQTGEQADSRPFNIPAPSSAARLAKPFDPLDAEPSAQPSLTQGIRRNATVAGTESKHNARRRRPYSDAFDGCGRVAWESVEGGSQYEDHHLPKPPSTTMARRREQAAKGRDRHQRRHEQLRRSATLHGSRLTSPFRRYDDEHHDDSTVEQINACVSHLIDLGYGYGESGSADRLLVYAQAAEGDLVEAIDMIEEEHRAYRGLS